MLAYISLPFREYEHPYGCFSNFSNHSIVMEGQTIWPTSEHWFQVGLTQHYLSYLRTNPRITIISNDEVDAHENR